jgi:beta-phosphoglucomutase-like phosphatase (HAD superfamily)
MRLAIATTTTLENVEALLRSTLGPGALTLFEVIGAGDVVERKKPAPDIYHYVLEAMGLAAEACLALEDSANGLGAAQGAGVATVITVNDYTAGDSFDGAAAVVDGLGGPDSPSRRIAGDPLYDDAYVTLRGLVELHRRVTSN